MIVSDLDGTLLRRDKTISAYTARILEEARQKGYVFAPATARPVRNVRDDLPFLEYDAAVYHNGAVIAKGEKRLGAFTVREPMPLIWKLLERFPGLCLSAESEEIHYANYDVGCFWPGMPYVKTADFAELEGRFAEKLLIKVDAPEMMDQIAALLPEELYAELCENTLVMVMHRQASKKKSTANLE